MLEELESRRDGHLSYITVFKYVIALLNKNARPVHSDAYGAGPTIKQHAAAEIDRMLAGKVIEPSTTK